MSLQKRALSCVCSVGSRKPTVNACAGEGQPSASRIAAATSAAPGPPQRERKGSTRMRGWRRVYASPPREPAMESTTLGHGGARTLSASSFSGIVHVMPAEREVREAAEILDRRIDAAERLAG